MKKVLAICFLLVSLFAACIPANSSSEFALTGNWTRHTLSSGWTGADGVDLATQAGVVYNTTAWEESNRVTVNDLAGTTVTAALVSGPEDAKFGDFNGDGLLDVVIASSGAGRIYIATQTSLGVYATSAIAASYGHGRWLQVAAVDWDSDGDTDVLGVGYSTGAVVAFFENTGAPSGWLYHKISDAGWGMTLQVADLNADGVKDVFITDRTKIGTSWALYGARWAEYSGALHQIGVAGSCPTCSPGDEMMGSITPAGFVECQSSAAKPNRVVRRTGSFATNTWTQEILPNPPFAHGHCQHVAEADMDLDGLPDVVVSTWEANTLPASSASGIYIIHNLGGGAWDFVDVSGGAGTKHDNSIEFDVDGDGDLDIVDSEQVENLGVFFLENPTL